MQIEEAKDTIARLIRESLPAASAPITAAPSAGGISFFGGTNVVQIHMAAPSLPGTTAAVSHVQADDRHPAIADRRREVIMSRIEAANDALGRTDLHLRFSRSVYGHQDLRRLDEGQLERILAFLNHELKHKS